MKGLGHFTIRTSERNLGEDVEFAHGQRRVVGDVIAAAGEPLGELLQRLLRHGLVGGGEAAQFGVHLSDRLGTARPSRPVVRVAQPETAVDFIADAHLLAEPPPRRHHQVGGAATDRRAGAVGAVEHRPRRAVHDHGHREHGWMPSDSTGVS